MCTDLPIILQPKQPNSPAVAGKAQRHAQVTIRHDVQTLVPHLTLPVLLSIVLNLLRILSPKDLFELDSIQIDHV